MGTTTKMAIPYPEATGLVKDGWEDMKDIATQVDAKSGLVLLNTTSFSAVSAVSLPQDSFTSNFDNYRWILRFTSSTGGEIRWRGRTAGSDNTNANYVYQQLEAFSTSITASRATGQTSGYVGYTDGNSNVFLIDIIEPKATQPTGLQSTQLRSYNATPLSFYSTNGFTATTSFDALSIYPTSGTITGTYSLFGYNK